MRKISQRELRNQTAAILRDIQRGETVLVTRNGTPVAELRTLPRNRFVPREVIGEGARGAPRVDYRRFRADLDFVVDQSPLG